MVAVNRTALHCVLWLSTCVIASVFLTYWTVPYFKSVIRHQLRTPCLLPPMSSCSATHSYINRIVHQSWKEAELPPRFAKWSDSWRGKCFPTWHHMLWTDANNRDFLAQHYPWFLTTYDNYPENIYRADAMRYFYLFHFGGIYTDLDTECVRPFEHLLSNYSLVFGAMKGQYGTYIEGGYVQNSFMYSRQGHSFWLEVIHEMMRRDTGAPEERTGPIMLVDMLNAYMNRMGSHTLKIYPPEYFNPFTWLESEATVPPFCKTFNQGTNEDYRMCYEYYAKNPNTYVVQYHAHTW